jgi:hypothetical protein
MKRLIAVVCLFCYVASAISLSFSVDYCNSEVKSISLYSAAETSCCCDNEINKECCESDQFSIQNTDEHRISALPDYAVKAFALPGLMPTFHTGFHFVSFIREKKGSWPLHTPPLLAVQFSLYKLYSVFRI